MLTLLLAAALSTGAESFDGGCNDQCMQIRDGNGHHAGYACITVPTTTNKKNCFATPSACNYLLCGGGSGGPKHYTSIMDASGYRLAFVTNCEVGAEAEAMDTALYRELDPSTSITLARAKEILRMRENEAGVSSLPALVTVSLQ